MWQKTQADLVNDEIEVLLASLYDVTGFCDIIRKPLAGIREMVLSETVHYKPWYLLPLVVCESISGHSEHAIPASAALKLFMAAGEVFDDIEDADAPGSLPARYGSAIATNVATALLILAEKAITRLKLIGVTERVIVRIMDAVNSFYTTACEGQHMDLYLTSDTSVSEDSYLKIVSMKSASTPECACHIGALLATESQELIDSFTLLGHNLGMASQIANDIYGITNGNDVIRHKITLPVIYALAHTEGKVHNQMESAFNKQFEHLIDLSQTKNLLFDSGAIYYGMVKMEFFKQNALDILQKLEKAGSKVERLKIFIE